jgi:hypothetical protein
MNEIQVRLLEPTDSGRLFYYPDPEIEPFVINIQNGLREKRAYSINIDGAIIIDLNHNHIIQSVEFNIHKKVWVRDPNFLVPQQSIIADI